MGSSKTSQTARMRPVVSGVAHCPRSMTQLLRFIRPATCILKQRVPLESGHPFFGAKAARYSDDAFQDELLDDLAQTVTGSASDPMILRQSFRATKPTVTFCRSSLLLMAQ